MLLWNRETGSSRRDDVNKVPWASMPMTLRRGAQKTKTVNLGIRKILMWLMGGSGKVEADRGIC